MLKRCFRQDEKRDSAYRGPSEVRASQFFAIHYGTGR